MLIEALQNIPALGAAFHPSVTANLPSCCDRTAAHGDCCEQIKELFQPTKKWPKKWVCGLLHTTTFC